VQVHLDESPFHDECARIARARAFRRLAGKTQVVPLPRGDHLRTRLTHVLEVSAIARHLARALALREPLAEAIALAHDLGHPPFGHVGERVLAQLTGGFHHAAHGVRIVEVLEPLGLSLEVRAGVLLHSKGRGPILPRGGAAHTPHATTEAAVARVADLIAYASHDADDALRLGYLHPDDLPAVVSALLRAAAPEADRPLAERLVRAFAGDCVRASRAAGPDAVALSPEGEAALAAMRDLLYARFYERAEMLAYVPTIREVLATVYESALRGRTPRAALDLVAGMTDRHAVARHGSLARTRQRRAARHGANSAPAANPFPHSRV
jgi:dGTPase